MKKVGSWIILAVLIGGVAFLSLYLLKGEERTSKQPLPTEVSGSNSKQNIEKYKQVQVEGYLTKEGDNYVMMGWELNGDPKELDDAVDHYVKATGEGENFVLNVSSLEVSEELSQISEEVVNLDGVLSKDNDSFSLNGVQLIGEVDLTSYVGKTIFLQGRKSNKENVIETIEVNETTVISGTLEYVAGEPPDIHYTLAGTDFDIHHNTEIFSQEGKHLDLLVYAKSHGVHIDDEHVTLIRILE